MKVLIILGHPDKKSFNHAIAAICRTQLEKNGHTVFFHDLYDENFSPLHQIDNQNTDSEIDKNIQTHTFHLKTCDAIIVIHPNWWGQPPAIVKGWLDRILLPGVAYDFQPNEKGIPVPFGILKAKTGLVFNTSNSPDDPENDPLELIWKKSVFQFCGISKNERISFSKVKESDKKERSRWLSEVALLTDKYFPQIKV